MGKPYGPHLVIGCFCGAVGIVILAVTLGVALTQTVSTPLGSLARGSKVPLIGAKITAQVVDGWSRVRRQKASSSPPGRRERTRRHVTRGRGRGRRGGKRTQDFLESDDHRVRYVATFQDPQKPSRTILMEVADPVSIPVSLSPVSRSSSSSGVQAGSPPAGVAFDGGAYVSHDGKLVLEHWQHPQKQGVSRSSSFSSFATMPGVLRLGIYIIQFQGTTACGTGTQKSQCAATCPVDKIKKMVYGDAKSVVAFWKLASGGRTVFSVSDANVHVVSVAGECYDVLDVPEMVQNATGVHPNSLYDNRAYFLPSNWKRVDALVLGKGCLFLISFFLEIKKFYFNDEIMIKHETKIFFLHFPKI